MKDFSLSHTLEVLQRSCQKIGVEINISPEGVSLWTSDASDYTCQDVSPEKAIDALNAIRKFRKYWKLKL